MTWANIEGCVAAQQSGASKHAIIEQTQPTLADYYC